MARGYGGRVVKRPPLNVAGGSISSDTLEKGLKSGALSRDLSRPKMKSRFPNRDKRNREMIEGVSQAVGGAMRAVDSGVQDMFKHLKIK